MISTNVLMARICAYNLHMKKKIAFIIAIVILATSIFALAACNKKEDAQTPSDISRVTESYLAGESDLFAVSVESGKREKIFIADGKATDVQSFIELKITPLKTFEQKSINFVLSAGEDSLSGIVEEGRGGEFKTDIALDFIPEKITLTAGEQTSEIDLCSVLEGAITADDAIEIVREAFKDKLDAEAAEGKTREIYVKLITGDRTDYYYYVSFIGDGVNYLAGLVGRDGTLISKR